MTAKSHHKSMVPPDDDIKLPEVMTRRKGGGTLIDSPAVFSEDGKHVYVNNGWGAKIFSIKTGECVKVLGIPRNERVMYVFSYLGYPYTLTSKYSLIKWDRKSAKILKDIKLNSEVLSNTRCTGGMLCPRPDGDKKYLCVFVKSWIRKTICLYIFSIETGRKVDHHFNEIIISSGKHMVSFGGPSESHIMACITEGGLNVYSAVICKKSPEIKPGGKSEWVSVQCHPFEKTVAAGDCSGRIVLFRDPFGHANVRTIFHWHTLPARVIAFSLAGSVMYSGGDEHTLVKWNTENPNVRNYLPRLSGPIVHITVSPDNNVLAVSTADNGIILVDSSNKLKCVLQQLSWGVLSNGYSQLFPAGLEYDPRTKSVVLNSRPGHLQFYQPDTETFLFGLDITQLNYLTQERDKVIINTEVTQTCISSDAAWLATVEMRKESLCSLELKLKFWLYDVSLRKFSLNTVINLPHSGEIDCLRFAPAQNQLFTSEKVDTNYLVVTTGKDRKFRFWAPYEIESVDKKRVSWNCRAVRSYKQKPCSYAVFSQDASLLAAAFDKSLTIWFVNSVCHRATLSRSNGPITHTEFGKDSCDHLIVACTKKELLVWNLVTLSLLWSINVYASILVADPASDFMAVFTSQRNVFVFNPMSWSPVYQEEKVCSRNSKILGAKFIPRESPRLKEEPKWLRKSVLYFLESNQELKCLDCESDDSKHYLDIVEDEERGTAFSKLIAEQNRDSNNPMKILTTPVSHQLGPVGSPTVNQVLMAPAHTLPPMSLLCSNILESLARHKNGGNVSSTKDKDEEEEDEIVDLENTDTDEETVKPLKKAAVVDMDFDLPFGDSTEAKDLFVLDPLPIENSGDNDKDFKGIFSFSDNDICK